MIYVTTAQAPPHKRAMIPSAAMTGANRPLFAVLLLSLGLNATAVWWGLPSRFAWAPDELQPAIILQGIDERFSGDWHQPAYPPFHYYVLAVYNSGGTWATIGGILKKQADTADDLWSQNN